MERVEAPQITRRPIDLAWTWVALLLPVVVTFLTKMTATDLAYQVRAGDEILATRAIPRVDTYTFSVAGAPWIDQQWGAQVVFSLLHKAAGGWSTVGVGRGVLTALIFAFVFAACRAAGAARRASALLTIASFTVAGPALAMRPQLVALPLFAASLWILADRLRHPRRVWIVPVLAAVCASLHGSFVLFPVLVGLAWLEARVAHEPDANRLLVVAGVTALATLANPYGWGAWTYAYDLSTSPVIRKSITEWQPVSLALISGWFMFTSGIAIAVFLARRGSPTPWPILVRLVVFFVLALSAQRAMVWWALVAPVALAPLFAGRVRSGGPPEPSTPRRESAGPAIVLVGALVVATIALLPWWRGSSSDVQLREAPPGLTAALAREVAPGGRVFAHQPWGSWFEYALPDRLYFVDSRIEILPASIWTDYDQVAFSGARWREVLEKWRPDAIVAEHEDWELIPILRDDSGWRVAYEDDDGVLFVSAR